MKLGMWDFVKEHFRDITQIAIFVMIAILFTIWAAFGSTTISKQNHAIVTAIRADLLAHSKGSQERQCAIATELAFLASHPPAVEGQAPDLSRPKWETRRINTLMDKACTFVQLPDFVPGA